MAVDKAVDSAALESDLTSVANAIRAKGGTTGKLSFPDGYVSAVNAISSGVDVKTASGSFTTSTKGVATINCGFKPDLIVIYITTMTSDGTKYENTIGMPIKERKYTSGYTLNNLVWYDADNLIEVELTSLTNTGATLLVAGYDSSWNYGYASRKTYSWKAVKYTA